jgi:hypothetical protein
MATLSDEHLRALRFLAQHRGGCAEVVLVAQGFTTAQLGHLVFAGLDTRSSWPPEVPSEDHRSGT